jgi:hypothetical protein
MQMVNKTFLNLKGKIKLPKMRLSYLRSPDGQWLLVESVDHIARVFAFSNDKVKRR